MRKLSIPPSRKDRGNALMEYVVPSAIIIVVAGVLTTVLGINKIMGKYFFSASGNTSANMQPMGMIYGGAPAGTPQVSGTGGATGTPSSGSGTPGVIGGDAGTTTQTTGGMAGGATQQGGGGPVPAKEQTP